MKLVRSLCCGAFLLLAIPAQAAITCTVSSPGFSTAYLPANPATNITQTSLTVTCQRNLVGDPTSVSYDVSVDHGLTPVGTQNRASAAGSFINYESHRSAACNAIWAKNPASTRIAGTINGLTGFIPQSQTVSYWGCVPAGQSGLPSGTYTDTVTMTMGGGATATGTFPVSIFAPASCLVTTPPGNVAFTYIALGAAANANTSFGVTCTNQLPYTMALDTATGVLVGLQYGLSLSAPGATGTGLQQTHAINGLIPAGQAGTCAGGSCAGTQTHTLTITY